MLINSLFIAAMSLGFNMSIVDQGDGGVPIDTTPSSHVFGEIQHVLHEEYIGGQIVGSSEMIQAAFHKDMVMMFPDHDANGESYLQLWADMHALAEEWAQTPHPEYDVVSFRILSLDVVDDRLATVLFEVEDRVYEALTLVKAEGKWTIVSKVFIEQ